MNTLNESDVKKIMKKLIDNVKELNYDGKYSEAIALVSESMQRYPHSPEPHNLMGIIMEVQHNHVAAMKHFRAAWALDPTYTPAQYNLETYGTLVHWRKSAYDLEDCVKTGGI